MFNSGHFKTLDFSTARRWNLTLHCKDHHCLLPGHPVPGFQQYNISVESFNIRSSSRTNQTLILQYLSLWVNFNGTPHDLVSTSCLDGGNPPKIGWYNMKFHADHRLMLMLVMLVSELWRKNRRTCKLGESNVLLEFASVNFTKFWDFVVIFMTTWSIHDQPIPSSVALKFGFLEVPTQDGKNTGKSRFPGTLWTRHGFTNALVRCLKLFVFQKGGLYRLYKDCPFSVVALGCA